MTRTPLPSPSASRRLHVISPKLSSPQRNRSRRPAPLNLTLIPDTPQGMDRRSRRVDTPRPPFVLHHWRRRAHQAAFMGQASDHSPVDVCDLPLIWNLRDE